MWSCGGGPSPSSTSSPSLVPSRPIKSPSKSAGGPGEAEEPGVTAVLREAAERRTETLVVEEVIVSQEEARSRQTWLHQQVTEVLLSIPFQESSAVRCRR